MTAPVEADQGHARRRPPGDRTVEEIGRSRKRRGSRRRHRPGSNDRIKIKLVSKIDALKTIGEHLGFLKGNRLEIPGVEKALYEISEKFLPAVKGRRNGAMNPNETAARDARVMGLAMNSPAAAAERTRVNLNQVLNPKHTASSSPSDPELLVYGGAGAGKSYSIADKLFLQGILNPEERQKIVVVRKTLASLRKSTLDIIERRAEALKRPFQLDRSTWTAKCGNQTWVFTGMNNREDYQKIKSLTDVNFIWANELTELREDDYQGALPAAPRGQGHRASTPSGSSSPTSTRSARRLWIYDRFWQRLPKAARKLRYTVLDNPWAEPEYIERLRQTAKDDQNFYKIYFLGEWGELEGVIFTWDVEPLPAIAFDEIFYGGRLRLHDRRGRAGQDLPPGRRVLARGAHLSRPGSRTPPWRSEAMARRRRG